MRHLAISWLPLLAAVLVLWTPLVLFVGRRLRRKLTFPERNYCVGMNHLLLSPWSWLDLLRAGAGAWVLVHVAIKVAVIKQTVGGRVFDHTNPYPALGLQVAILGIGVLLQLFATGNALIRVAPLFYLLGIALGVAPWEMAVFGGLLALTIGGLVRWPLGVFLFLPVCYAGFAFLFRQLSPLYLVPAALSGFAFVCSLLIDRPLAWLVTHTQARE